MAPDPFRRRLLHDLTMATIALVAALATIGADAMAEPPSAAPADAVGTGLQPSDSGQSAADDDPYRVFRSPLLREGSTLVEARARLRRGGPQNWWLLALDPQQSPAAADVALTAGAASGPHELIVLPCTRLTEMERIIEAAPGDQAANMQFEVSGRVYVFRDRNYILPTHAAVISASPEPGPPPPTPEPSPPVTDDRVTDEPSAPASTAPAPPPPPDDDSAEAIARALQQQAGPLARSSAHATAPRPADDTPTSIAVSAPDGRAADRLPTLQENTAVVNRRGKITRDRSGGWMLVLDADASGLADPPLKLLPCMLLEDIEDYARRTGNNSPIIVTGQVYLYSGQNHLLPTVYRIPRETSRLTP